MEANMSDFVTALKLSRVYAQCETNPMLGDDPDDIAEAWNSVRDEMDIRTGSTLTPRQLDLVADEVINIWRK